MRLPIANHKFQFSKNAASAEGAFTLIEVILAVVIAAGLLVVAISYYQSAAELRERLLEESNQLSTMRLMMDRVSSDLRTALAEPRQGFTGGSDFMRFVHAGSPTPGNLADGALKLVNYGVVTNAEGTNVAVIGFNRLEEPLVEKRVAATNQEAISFNGGMDPMATTTNAVVVAAVEPMTRAIRFVQFRYFSGSEWLDAWDAADLPLGVEVTFGAKPASPEGEEYSGELFRRVIAVPSGRASTGWEGLP